MNLKYFKRAISLFLLCVFITSLFGCSKNEEIVTSGEKPQIEKLTSEPQLDFVMMHNFVIDSLTSQITPFFYIVEGKFDISGTNNPNCIKVSCTCLDGTTVDDLDLFLSLVLNNIAFAAAEQDFRFESPKTDSTGTFVDFGTVFNTYDLEFDCSTENGTSLRKERIPAKSKIPIEPRYWIN